MGLEVKLEVESARPDNACDVKKVMMSYCVLSLLSGRWSSGTSGQADPYW